MYRALLLTVGILTCSFAHLFGQLSDLSNDIYSRSFDPSTLLWYQSPGIQSQVTGKGILQMAGQLPPRAGHENWSSGWDEPGLKFEARVQVSTDGGTSASAAVERSFHRHRYRRKNVFS